jgi:transcriptional regulator with XRE-family HTH domain
MKLAAYLKRKKMRPSRFAEKVGVPASTILRILAGQRTPRLETILMIEEATENEVTLGDFIKERKERPSRSRELA